jgi:aryl-alcohol dehydrogenase-like predicted oxidoreductase
MLTRREYLAFLTLACAGLSLPRFLNAQLSGPLITGTIPSTGEELPIIGLGSSATFGRIAQQGDLERIKAVMQMMVDCGGSVFDTAPGYRASEAAAGRAIHELGIADRIFWATKLNVAGFRGGSADPDEARAQVEASFQRLDRGPIDLIQVHNLGDMATQFAILRELKDAGRVRYIGTTSTFKPQYEALAGYMRNEPLDFVGTSCSASRRIAALPSWSTCRSAGTAFGTASRAGKCRPGRASSVRRPGRSSS